MGFLLTVNATPAQAGSDLAITEFIANRLVAKLTATDAMLGTDYTFEAVIHDGVQVSMVRSCTITSTHAKVPANNSSRCKGVCGLA